ncbi:2290_t:CDS:2 [Cetraspora pellucida]|uniref:2290_t:CDS:1 n=1 Tax=Cetraspora pellucida TaxID=1433469 RepID=A0ACA9N7L2_9GLOM|nr:2290_t:CDS:2 [Cetraspora pellucida]
MSNKKHTGGKPKHNLTNHVIVTNEYVNPEKPSDKWCLCRYCDNVGDKVKVVNRWRLVRNHLKKCNNFFNEFGHAEAEKKLQEAEQEYISKKEARKRTTKLIKSSTSQNTNTSNLNKMAHYLARTLTYKEQSQFEKHILNMTIENGWSFRWTEPKSLLLELEKFRKQQKPFTLHVANQFAKDILGYWEFCSDAAKELNNSEIPNSTQNNQDYTMIISDSKDDEIQEQERNNNAISVEEWSEIVSKWVTMINDDERLDENAIILNQTGNIDHPSINKDAKWNLSSLFSQDLPTPPYFFELEE